MSAFTPTQEARLREIVREELAVQTQSTVEILKRVTADDQPRCFVTHHPISNGRPSRTKRVSGSAVPSASSVPQARR